MNMHMDVYKKMGMNACVADRNSIHPTSILMPCRFVRRLHHGTYTIAHQIKQIMKCIGVGLAYYIPYLQ